MLDPDTITQQLALLAAHRRTLAHLLEQAAAYGGVILAPPQTARGILDARANIAHIKVALREGGAQVDDNPNDEAPPQADVNQTAGAGPHVQSTVTVQDNKGTVIGVQIKQLALAPALHQLRAPVSDFVGREREIDQLVQALRQAATSGAAAAISGVRGMGGIGKTELAYVVANRLKDAFPDAQLVIELRGTSSSPLTPEQALQTVIRSFEREAKLPDDLNELGNIYASVLTGKRALILADDAKDAAQVRPLLPPQGTALLVTSRNRFSLPGMAAFDLGTLTPAEAEQLLLEICSRIGEHAPKLATLCGYLPLALRVSAGVLANSPRNVPRYLEQLQAERLKHLSDPDIPDDPQASVEASLKLSYDALEPAAQSALCQTSVFPTSFDLRAAGAVVEIEDDVSGVLELLRRRSLLEWDTTAERYDLHDLVRVFGAVRLEDVYPAKLRHAQHYAWMAEMADDRFTLGGEYLLLGLELFDQERAQIDAGRTWAIAHADDQVAAELLLHYINATTVIGDLRYDLSRERIPQYEAALRVARQLGNRRNEAALLDRLGVIHKNLGRVRQAKALHEQALVIAREQKDREGEGGILGNLGNVYLRLGEPQQAIAFYEQALVIARELGSQEEEGSALGNLGNLGNAYANLGDFQRALDCFSQSLRIAREQGDRLSEGNAFGNMGRVYALLGDTQQAVALYGQRLLIARELGDRRGEASVSWNLGLEFAKQGDLARAIAMMEVWMDFHRESDHPDTESNAARLEQLRQRLAASQTPLPADTPDEG